VGEILGVRLLTIHNVRRYQEFVAEMRAALAAGAFGEWRAATAARLAEQRSRGSGEE
jgi:queuine/archaeosine tRNA-ribosyltransferase